MRRPTTLAAGLFALALAAPAPAWPGKALVRAVDSVGITVSDMDRSVRFGTDPRASALDVNCKAHDVDNLYVVDASFFPSSSAVNPALTIMANALRVGDHLRERLG